MVVSYQPGGEREIFAFHGGVPMIHPDGDGLGQVYRAALKDPDSLADVPTDGDCCCETFCYVGSYAYEAYP
mgnify:CR=1 FL=1